MFELLLGHWKLIPDFPQYMISSDGRVWSCKRRKLLKLFPNNNGYYCVSLMNNSKIHPNIKVHRLVAQSFVSGKSSINIEVDHIDGNNTNNLYSNLRWVTHKENMNNQNTIQKISITNSGTNHPFYGRKHTEETKQKMSKSKRKLSGLD